MTESILLLLVGLLCAGGGGELFIRGVVSLAAWARIPAGVVGATIAAFATSSPELSVAISSARSGTPTISVGDAIGSNVVNLGAVLGIALLISSTTAPRESMKRDFPVALLTPFVIGLLAMDGELSRIDGLVLLGLCLAWFIATVREALRSRAVEREGEKTEEVLAVNRGQAALFSLIGLVLLVISGRTIVSGAVGIATHFGLDAFVIGATVVALGTSAPELATTLLARARGHEEVALGTVLGSNIFNGLFVVGLVALLSPMRLSFLSVVAGLATSAVLTLCAYPPRSGVLDRRRGALLLAVYLVYTVALLQMRPTVAGVH